jgi:hypothetical protein
MPIGRARHLAEIRRFDEAMKEKQHTGDEPSKQARRASCVEWVMGFPLSRGRHPCVEVEK